MNNELIALLAKKVTTLNSSLTVEVFNTIIDDISELLNVILTSHSVDIEVTKRSES